MEEELRRVNIKSSGNGMVAQLQTAVSSHGLTPKEVASQLNAYLINHGVVGQPPSASLLSSFLAGLQRSSNKENQLRGLTTPGAKWDGSKSFAGFPDTLKGDQQGPPATPLTGRKAAAAAAGSSTPLATDSKASPVTPRSAPRTAFKNRSNRGQVVSTLNPSIPRASSAEARFLHAEPRGVQLPPRHLYMMERLEDKVAAINSRITTWRKWLSSALTAAAAPAAGQAEPGSRPKALEVTPVGVPVQEESYFVGRVVCEVEGGALNDTAVVLEGDTSTSDGARVPLDLTHLTQYRLFPGQVIAVKGVNPSGSRILAKHIWTHLPPSSTHNSTTPAAAAADSMDIDGLGVGAADACSSGLSVAVAAGPFTLSDDVGYDPLHELLQDLKNSPPNMLVLLGPFVDVDQPVINDGMLDVTFQQLFQTQVLERLHAWQAALASPCQVVLLPAVRDVFHHPTFPQPAIDIQPPEQQLVSLQNPCSISVDGLLLAGTTSDVLRHLSSVELAKTEPGVPADRLGALASHVIGQRRFYPLYPAPPGTCLDLTADPALVLQQLPDLLLLPSDLAPFAKLVAAAPATATGGCYAPTTSPAAEGSPQVVVVNPGRLAKGGSGGTYAHVTVAAGNSGISSRCRVDIVRV